MAIVVNTNQSSLLVQKNLNKAQSSLNASIERMSTGYKVNRAADDAAGLSIATKMNTQIRGSEVAKSNIQQGINVLQTTEGDLTSIQTNLNRIRDLALQASNGVNSTESTDAMISEVKALVDEINRTAQGSEFNGKELLSADAVDSIRIQVGPNSESSINAIDIEDVFGDAQATALGLLDGTANFDTIDDAFATDTDAASFVEDCDNALKEISGRISGIGAYQNRLTNALDGLTVRAENLTSAKSTIMDADVATEASTYTKASILQQASAALLAQANQSPSIALTLI